MVLETTYFFAAFTLSDLGICRAASGVGQYASIIW
jgi:hypothetical protein